MQWLNNYLVAPTHKWWVDNVWRPSWTKLSAAIYGIPSLLILAVEEIAKYANDTTITGYLSQMGVPNGVFMALASVALVSYIASGRD